MTSHSLPAPLWAPETLVRNDHPLFNSALKPLQDDASLADWLFRCPWNVYRTDISRLSTSSFSNAKSLSLVHVENNDDGRPSMALSSQATMHLIPAARTPTGGIVGYLFSYGNGADVQSRPFGAIPGIPGLPAGRAQFHGRFVYDTQNSHFIITLVHGSGNLLSMASFKTVGDGRRERTFFTFPLQEYTSEDLRNPPVIAAISATEFRTESATTTPNSSENSTKSAPSFSIECGQSLWTSDWTNDWNDMSPELMTAEIASSLPCESQGKCLDQSVDPWDLSGISSALEELQRDMLGTYYSPAIKLDIASQPTVPTHKTKSLTTLMRGELHAQVVLADTYVQAELRELAVQTYHMQGFHLVPPAVLDVLPTFQANSGQNDRKSCMSFLEDLFTICEAETSTESNNLISDHEVATAIPPDSSHPKHGKHHANANVDHTTVQVSPTLIEKPPGIQTHPMGQGVFPIAIIPATTVPLAEARRGEDTVRPPLYFMPSLTKQRSLGNRRSEKGFSAKRLLPRPIGSVDGTGATSARPANPALELTVNKAGDLNSESKLEEDKTPEEKRLDVRRRRHRESSAAYHARQRQRFQSQADEVASLKARMESLFKRKEQLQTENQTLRSQLGCGLSK